jgi:hypothetical protein
MNEIEARAPSSLGGFYRTQDKTVYVIPVNLAELAQSMQWEERRVPALIKHILAHEVAHALQEQEGGLTPIAVPKTFDESLARSALKEGHATFVSEKVDELLGSGSIEAELTTYYQKMDIPKDDTALRALRLILENSYWAGSKFIAHINRGGGMEAVWKLFDAPPTDMGMVLHPEQYSPQPRRVKDYIHVFDGAEKQLGNMQCPRNIEQMGPWLLQLYNSEVKRLPPESKAMLEDHVVTCVHSMAVDKPQFWYITLFELKDEQSGVAVEALFKELRKPALLTDGEISPTRFDPNGKSLEASDTGPRMWTTTLRHGKYVFDFYGWYNGVSKESLTTFAEKVWSRVDSDDRPMREEPELNSSNRP